MKIDRAPFVYREPRFDRIPVELKKLDQWVCWKFVPTGKGKPTKQPISALSGRPASTSASHTWASFDDACAAFVREGHDGIGFVFTAKDKYFGADLDNVRNNETGALRQDALELVQSLDTYTEISVSGTGLHAIGGGKLPGPGRCDHQLGFELYDQGRYFTFTGEWLFEGEGIQRVEWRQDELNDAYTKYWPHSNNAELEPLYGTVSGALNDLPISFSIKRLVATGEGLERYDNDRSRALFKACIAMVKAGVTEQTIADILSDKAHKLSTAALERRHGNVESAKQWLIQHCIRPAAQAVGGEALQDTPQSEGESRFPAAIDLELLSQTEPVPPKFIINDWLPCGYVSLLGGHGGQGKSQVALYQAVCIALGIDWFGMPTEHRRVHYMSCEDNVETLHWRLSRICADLGIDMASLAGKLFLYDLVGRDMTTWRPFGFERPEALSWIDAQVSGDDVVYIDGVSDTFGGNENDRGHVKRYINTWLGVISPRGAVVILAHVDKGTAKGSERSSEGYSGNTQWHNGVRNRWYLAPENDSQDADLILEVQKNNLGRKGHGVRLSWNKASSTFDGVPITPPTGYDAVASERRERNAILDCFKAIQATGDYVPSATTGMRTAFHVLSACPEFPPSITDSKADRARFWRHIEALRRMNEIEDCIIRRGNRHTTNALRLKT